MDGGKSVFKSCNGDFACNRAGGNKNGRYEGEPNEGEYEGYIGIVAKSCIGTQACEKAADGGYIGSITKSCHGKQSCWYAGELGPKQNEKSGSITILPSLAMEQSRVILLVMMGPLKEEEFTSPALGRIRAMALVVMVD